MGTLEIHTYRDRYPKRFVLPRTSRHNLVFKRFVPGRFLHSTYDGAAIMPRLIGPDLTHAWNRVPVNPGRFIISFESHLPRVFDKSAPFAGAFETWMRKRISSRACRRITALSHYAKRQFLSQNSDRDELQLMQRKLIVRYPNVEVSDRAGYDPDRDIDTLKIAFVGGHFARKGGLAVLRLAELCDAQKLPVEFTVVSSLSMGGEIWTDPTESSFYEPYEKLFNLENVTVSPALSNTEVRALFARSDLHILPTFADTFGYSVIESMAEFCPAIVSDSGVFPEFLAHGENGFFLSLETDSDGSWVGNHDYALRHTAAYEKMFADQIESFAEESLKILVAILEQPARLKAMRIKARDTVDRLFAPAAAAKFWDPAYERYAAEPLGSDPHKDELDLDSPSLI